MELVIAGEPVALPQGIEVTAYRTVQEALTNTLKHAAPARARIELTYRPDELLIEVRDDGSGPAGGNGHGHGLAGMRQRVALYGGAHELGTSDHRGFRVRARLPVGGDA